MDVYNDNFNNKEYIIQGYELETDNTNVSISFLYNRKNAHKIQINISNNTSSDQKVNIKYIILYITI